MAVESEVCERESISKESTQMLSRLCCGCRKNEGNETQECHHESSEAEGCIPDRDTLRVSGGPSWKSNANAGKLLPYADLPRGITSSSQSTLRYASRERLGDNRER